MTLRKISEHKFFRPAASAAFSVLCGLVLLFLSLGNLWVRASYDNLFRFGARTTTNQVVLVLMDNEAYAALGQSRDQPWDRALHADLLNKLAADRCPLVVMDIFFLRLKSPAVDQKLLSAISQLTNVVLAADHASLANPRLDAVRPILPEDRFLAACKTNWGMGLLDPDLDLIVRHHWPYPSPGPYPSLAWTAAKISGAHLDDVPVKRWIRYYDVERTFTILSYNVALTKGPGYFRDKIVFIGNEPRTSLPDKEPDKFLTPHYNWTGETVGGVQILATLYLNLVNGDALHRMDTFAEVSLLAIAGILLGAGLPLLSRRIAILLGLSVAVLIIWAAVLLSYFTNYWFPWLIVVGGQIPCAMIWAVMPGGIKVVPREEMQQDESNGCAVFISHASKDVAVAEAICAALEAGNISCWIANRNVLPGIEYGEAILNAIEQCQVMVLVFSDHANKSPHVRSEVERAVSKGKTIVTFRIEKVLPAKALEFHLSNRNWMDAFTPPLTPHIANLVNAVGQLLKNGGFLQESPSGRSPQMMPQVSADTKQEGSHGTVVLNAEPRQMPDAPEFEIFPPPVGHGAFGTVWIVRNAIGQWQALKAVYAANFGGNHEPYEAEFKGLQNYKPVSEKHPGLLRIELVSKMKPEGYFYYVMELGDAQIPGWEIQPRLYKPLDLEVCRYRANQHRLPVPECLRIVIALADALDFLHQQGLAHRDIKPSNVIFVKGQPKLADIGLVAKLRPPDQIHTIVGTPGFMPPQPEPPGTKQADIYALGMVLYVISTGHAPELFPQKSQSPLGNEFDVGPDQLHAIILKACQTDLTKRYQSAREMLYGLQQIAQ